MEIVTEPQPSKPIKHNPSAEKPTDQASEKPTTQPLLELHTAPPTSIGNGKYIKVCRYRQKPYVNIRDYATTSSGKLYSTKRGILLRPEEWKQLKKNTKEVDQALKKL